MLILFQIIKYKVLFVKMLQGVEMGKVFLLIVLALVGIVSSHDTEKDLITKLNQGLQELETTRVYPSYLNDTLQQLQVPHLFRRSDIGYKKTHQLEDSTLCSLCYSLVNFLVEERRSNVSLDIIALEAEAICTILGIETGRVCTGVIELNIPIFTYLVDANPDLKGERICDIILQSAGCNATTFEWTIDVPEGQTVPRKAQSDPESTFNILHISDFHYDPLYTQGKTRICDEPLCCQDDQEDGSDSDGTACGYWSEYETADSSEGLVDESIRKANEFDFDYVYYTGDIISHRVWSTSIENNTRDLKRVFEKMKSGFKGKPIYPVLGNHEPSPLNEFTIGADVDAGLSTEWLYELIVSEFSEFLPESAQEDLMKGGYYSVSPKEGFRVIGLNSNVAYIMNWWLIHNDTDPFGQLAWLAKTLKEAEDNEEVVHILLHIPSGKSDLLSVWSREYHRIIERFANTIGAQFNGHTHKDGFGVHYSSSNASEAISVALNGASVICDKSNPSFKIINVDNSNFDVRDEKQWTFNLTEANLALDAPPNWYQLYSFKESYGINSLAPSEFSELMPRMAATHDMLFDFHVFRYRNADWAVESGCDNGCKKGYLCEIVTSQVGDSTQCDLLKEIFDEHV